jgi:hypothetical protein
MLITSRLRMRVDGRILYPSTLYWCQLIFHYRCHFEIGDRDVCVAAAGDQCYSNPTPAAEFRAGFMRRFSDGYNQLNDVQRTISVIVQVGSHSKHGLH